MAAISSLTTFRHFVTDQPNLAGSAPSSDP